MSVCVLLPIMKTRVYIELFLKRRKDQTQNHDITTNTLKTDSTTGAWAACDSTNGLCPTMRFCRVVGFSVDPSSIYSKINLDERKVFFFFFLLIKETNKWIV